MIEGLFVAIDAYNRSRIEQDRAAELFACPAVIAKHRLRQVIAADREAVPAGAWRPRVKGEFYPGKTGCLPFKVKPRWRWERRP